MTLGILSRSKRFDYKSRAVGYFCGFLGCFLLLLSSSQVGAGSVFRGQCEEALHRNNLVLEFYNAKNSNEKVTAAAALLTAAGIPYAVTYKGVFPFNRRAYLTNIDLRGLAKDITWICRNADGKELNISSQDPRSKTVVFDPLSNFGSTKVDSVILQRNHDVPLEGDFTLFLSQAELIRIVEMMWENKNSQEQRPTFEILGHWFWEIWA